MFIRILIVLAIALTLGKPAQAGIYNTTDAPEETSKLSQDFGGVFRHVLSDLQLIPNPLAKRNPPIRRRYMLMESLGTRGALDLRSVEAKLDYSAVLIRRGKAEEAVAILLPLTREHGNNFVLHAQCATAHFLAGGNDLRANALGYMQIAMDTWPQRWDQLDAEQKQFLTAFGWEETALARNRSFETYLYRLMKNRIKEERLKRKKLPVPETVDPIFGPADAPVKFVNDTGEFVPGQIPAAELKKLPKEAWDVVEQLLVWMPLDDRLLWLLGEVLNADAMNQTNAEAKNAAIRNAHLVFKKLADDAFGREVYARKAIEHRYEVLSKVVAKMPPPRLFDPAKAGINFDDENDKPATQLTNEQWWRALVVCSITGFAVGMFALWQFQEMRRRRAR